MRIYKENNDVIFDSDYGKYTLTSHPYEPCLYINQDGEIIKIIHNAFEAQDLSESFASGHCVLAPDGMDYDEESFCKALEAALEYEKNECNFTFAAELSRLEKKCPHDFITDGILNYGVDVGRFVFDDENTTVYAVSDLPHISASDAFTLYQISPEDYKKLLKFSLPDRIPSPPVSKSITDKYQRDFLCGESAYQARYYFRLRDADKRFIVKNQPNVAVMNFCPQCGKKNDGDKFCRNCGTKLIKKDKKMKILKITGTSCTCKFHLEGGEIVSASSEFKGQKSGVYEGQYVYKNSLRFSSTNKPLNEAQTEELVKAYEAFAKERNSNFEIVFFEDAEPRLIESGEYMGVSGLIYEQADGTIVASTLCSECKIADSLEEFKSIPREKLEKMVYSSEMSAAR